MEQGNDPEPGAQIGQVERETPALQVSQIPSGHLNMAIVDTPIFIIFHIFSEIFSTAGNVTQISDGLEYVTPLTFGNFGYPF